MTILHLLPERATLIKEVFAILGLSGVDRERSPPSRISLPHDRFFQSHNIGRCHTVRIQSQLDLASGSKSAEVSNKFITQERRRMAPLIGIGHDTRVALDPRDAFHWDQLRRRGPVD